MSIGWSAIAAVDYRGHQKRDEQRRSARLQKFGIITRLVFYAALFGALAAFMPESIQQGQIFTRSFSDLSLGVAISELIWLLLCFRICRAFFDPNPNPAFREDVGRLGLAIVQIMTPLVSVIGLVGGAFYLLS